MSAIADSFNQMVPKRIYLPTEFVKDHRELVGRHWASAANGKAATNYEQMLISYLATVEASDEVKESLLVVAPYALRDEYDRPIKPAGMLPDPFGCCSIRDSPWKRDNGKFKKVWDTALPPGPDDGPKMGRDSRFGPSPPGPAPAGLPFHGYAQPLPGGDGGPDPSDTAAAAAPPSGGVSEPTPSGSVDKASSSYEKTELSMAHLRGETVTSTVCKDRGESGSIVNGADTAPESTGVREAKSRFPHVADKPAYLFSQNPENLVAGESLRNVEVGRVKLKPETVRAMNNVTDLLIKHVFTKDKVREASRKYAHVKSTLPTKFSEAQKEKMVQDSLSETGLFFNNDVDAFVKAELVNKKKPRLIANHGARRLAALAYVAKIYETVLFNAFEYASIKNRPKKTALTEIAKNMAKVRGANCGGIENDLTAFEFGIGAEHKRCEQKILKHIASLLDLTAHGTDKAEFERVVDQRDKCVRWVMKFVDPETGEHKRVTITMERPARESGDRLTSSGNWLQNLIAWILILTRWTLEDLEMAILSWLKNKGRYFIYVSRLDGHKYFAVLAFEGDDTLGKLSEVAAFGEAERFMRDDYGWKPKLKAASATGDAVLTFVGVEMLFKDGAPVIEGGTVVCQPELKRCLQTKSFTVTSASVEEAKFNNKVYATVMAEQFQGNPIMVAFFNAMNDDNDAAPTKLTEDCRKFVSLQRHGNVDVEEEVETTKTECVSSEAMMRLATVAAGPYTPIEYATGSAITTLLMSGDELRSLLPKAWVA
jgi:hypothetical protein